MLRGGLAAILVLAGCAASGASVSNPAPAAMAKEPAVVAPTVAPPAAPQSEPSAEAAPPPPPEKPLLHVDVERPFRIDQRIIPQEREAFLKDLRERERWNKGNLGELAKPAPPVPGHPAPKVIIDVVSARGGHLAEALQRDARRLFWMRVVNCYGAGAYKDQSMRGKARLRFQVSRTGKVTTPKVLDSSFKDAAVAGCFAAELTKLQLSKARSGSTVVAEIQVGPGDEPMPPPPSVVVPGDGAVDVDAVEQVVRSALPAFSACFEAALDYAPELWGRLGVRFHVTEKGKLDEAFEVESRFPDERVTLCVLRASRALVFPKPKGGDARFVVPLRFSTDASTKDAR